MMKFLAIAGVIGLLSAGTGWMAASDADTARPDCPGKIVCPLSGEQVCADQCPVDTANVPTASSKAAEKAADELCGGACPVPTPKPDKPKGDTDKQSAVAIPTSPDQLTGGCCR